MQTAIATNSDIQFQVPDEVEIENAEQIKTILASEIKDDKPTELSIALSKDYKGTITLTPLVAHSLLKLLELISSGKGIEMIPVEANLTTQQAADFLNIPREYLNKLLDAGEISYKQGKKHKKIRMQELYNYRKKRDATRSDALKRIIEMDGKEIFPDE